MINILLIRGFCNKNVNFCSIIVSMINYQQNTINKSTLPIWLMCKACKGSRIIEDKIPNVPLLQYHTHPKKMNLNFWFQFKIVVQFFQDVSNAIAFTVRKDVIIGNCRFQKTVVTVFRASTYLIHSLISLLSFRILKPYIRNSSRSTLV